MPACNSPVIIARNKVGSKPIKPIPLNSGIIPNGKHTTATSVPTDVADSDPLITNRPINVTGTMIKSVSNNHLDSFCPNRSVNLAVLKTKTANPITKAQNRIRPL